MLENPQKFEESKNILKKPITTENNEDISAEEIDLEEKIKKSKNNSIFKKIQSVIQTIKNKTQDLILPKIRSKFKSSSVFETVQDAGSIFKMERKIGDYLILIALFFFLTSFIQFIIILALLPLKEKEPYLVTFTNDTQSFAIIQKADQSITANEALNRQLLGAYILSRESINRIDDKQRNEIIREQSSPEVWNVFERIIAQEDSIYSNENLTRVVRIVNISIIKKGYANADVSISLFYNGVLKSEKRYRIIISYKFKTLAIDYKSLPKNPTGFTVTGYSITEIATIKDLDEENKVNSSKSRIKYKDNKSKKDSDEDIINDAYFYQEAKEKTNYQTAQKSNSDNQENSKKIDISDSNDLDTPRNNSIEDKKTQIKEQIQNIKTLLEQHQDDLSSDELKKLEKQLQELQKQDLENNNLDSSKNQILNTPSPFNGNKKDGE